MRCSGEKRRRKPRDWALPLGFEGLIRVKVRAGLMKSNEPFRGIRTEGKTATMQPDCIDRARVRQRRAL